MARLLFLIIGRDKPSSKKRVLDSLEYLRAKGHDASVREIPHNFPGQILMLKRLGRHDVVVIQKKLFNLAQLGLVRLFSRKLVYDLDDAVMFHEIERNEPLRGRYFVRFAAAAARCDRVICGNGFLASFAEAARGGRSGVVVLPTPVDTRKLTPKGYKTTERVTIGWVGTKGNLPCLELIKGPLRELSDRYPSIRVKVISNAAPKLDGVPVEFKKWSAEEEAEDLMSLDIGVMPLEDNPWTRGKGGFKLLQYMSAGVPSIASPVGINTEIIRDGENGFLAGNERQWYASLEQLIVDSRLREKIGRAGRDTAERDFSLIKYNDRLSAILEELLD